MSSKDYYLTGQGTRDNAPEPAPDRATDALTGIPVATALFDSLDGRDMFLMALAARDLVVTEMTDTAGGFFHVAYLMSPTGPDTDRMADDDALLDDESWAWQ